MDKHQDHGSAEHLTSCNLDKKMNSKYIYMERIDGVNSRLDDLLYRRGWYPRTIHGRRDYADTARSRRYFSSKVFDDLESELTHETDEKPLTRR